MEQNRRSCQCRARSQGASRRDHSRFLQTRSAIEIFFERCRHAVYGSKWKQRYFARSGRLFPQPAPMGRRQLWRPRCGATARIEWTKVLLLATISRARPRQLRHSVSYNILKPSQHGLVLSRRRRDKTDSQRGFRASFPNRAHQRRYCHPTFAQDAAGSNKHHGAPKTKDRAGESQSQRFKDYGVALDRLPNQKYDPWGVARPVDAKK